MHGANDAFTILIKVAHSRRNSRIILRGTLRAGRTEPSRGQNESIPRIPMDLGLARNVRLQLAVDFSFFFVLFLFHRPYTRVLHVKCRIVLRFSCEGADPFSTSMQIHTTLSCLLFPDSHRNGKPLPLPRFCESRVHGVDTRGLGGRPFAPLPQR